jgi:hypothetical protein
MKLIKLTNRSGLNNESLALNAKKGLNRGLNQVFEELPG